MGRTPMATKRLMRVEVKDADKGTISAVFATLNVIDSDDDVTPNGAFEDGAKTVISAYGHGSSRGTVLPVGKGTIREVGNEAVMDGGFFMDNPDAAATFRAVKALAEDDLGEWSYNYDPIEFSFGEFEGRPVRFLKKLNVFEVSPVLRGAGLGTRTIEAKSLKFPEHAESVLADVDELVARASEILVLRAEKGKGIAPASADLMAKLTKSIERLREMLAEPVTDTSPDEFRHEYARFVALTQKERVA